MGREAQTDQTAWLDNCPQILALSNARLETAA